LWNRNWIPFASNGGGDFYCIDLAPTETGVKGQIITMKHETGQHKRLAASLRDWLDMLAHDLEAGKFEYREGKGLV